VEYIDLFLSSLRLDLPSDVNFRDVDATTQAELQSFPTSSKEAANEDIVSPGTIKVSTICDAILAELLAKYAKTHTQSILTAHLSKIPPDIPSALRVIAQLKGSHFREVTNQRRRL
jgi:elongator complex protein 1